jgi:hypothetical protein
VVCPFCQATVNAPAASTLAGPAMAAPVVAEGFQDAAQPVRPASGNLIAISALVAIILSIALLIIAGISLAPYMDEFKEITDAMTAGKTDQIKEAQQRFVEKHGGMPVWLLHALILFMGSMFAWLAGVVCGLLGLRNRRRKGLAILALVLAAVVPIMVCCTGG